MVRPGRVLSFMSEWGGSSPHRRAHSSTGASPAPSSPGARQPAAVTPPNASTTTFENHQRSSSSPSFQPRDDSAPSSRPMSMIQTYQPPVMEVSEDTLPELQRIFTFLNSHSNKLYQEGYFLKFHDTDSRGRPAPDRAWQECFAQLVGTVLSLWDASELDKVGGDAEVLPTFINLTDAAIHMMPSMVLSDGKKLDNILSVSTAASNKYLFHFNSFNSLTQWTAGIRLAMYEHTTLQEAYTGALIAGKGKTLNNIRAILDRQRAKHEDWARVRFGAGTPWRRCWCVVTPPDEKEYAKLQKSQKKSLYSKPVVLKGDMKFYDTKKITKKTQPIATVRDAYSAFAIYPQSKPLIDQSTLVKIEGKITIHSKQESVTDGFVFVMPETHPAVSGFEIMLRFLFPVFDTFALYGRPHKLISDVLDTRGLMFAMPPDRRYGYLEMWDVVSLIHEEGSSTWSERQWRKQLKDLTSKRMATSPARDRGSTRSRSNTVGRTSLPPSRSGVLRFEENGSARSQPSTRQASPTRPGGPDAQPTRRVDSAPATSAFSVPRHQRSISEHANGYRQYRAETPSRLAYGYSADSDEGSPPPPPEHRVLNGTLQKQDSYDTASEGEGHSPHVLPEVPMGPSAPPSGPVAAPPSFAHAPSQKPPVQPRQPPSAMKPSSHMDSATLDQLADATNAPLPAGVAVAGAAAAWRSQESLSGRRSGELERNQMYSEANSRGSAADPYYQSPSSSRSGHSGSRLPTIPASPYVEHSEFVDSPVAYQPTAPPVPEHAELPQTRPSLEMVQHQRPGSGSNQIHRKPVPGRSSTMSSRGDNDNHSTASSSLGSLRNDVIDPHALDNLDYTDATPFRHGSKSSSRYDDDAASTSTPDYASTTSEEVQPRRLPERRSDRPRSGVLTFVGSDPNPKADVVVGDVRYTPDAEKESSNIPAIDFGPTYSLAPNAKRPGTSGTMTQDLHDNNNFTRSKENMVPSPNDQKRHSYLSGRTTPTAAAFLQGNSPSASPQASDDRSVAWQPGMAHHAHSNSTKLEPDEWVAQRAAAAYVQRPPPVNAHGRNKSHTPPPMNRTHSGDWTHVQRTPEAMPARPPSRPLSRPNSRNASHLLDARPTSLSAREQEQIARVTGTPLIDLTKNTKEKNPSAGLTAYIDHREKEKAAAKANRNTTAMQAEIDRRMMAAQQRQMLEMQQMAQQQQQAIAQAGYGTPAGYSPQAFAYSTPNQMQQMYHRQHQGHFPQQGMSPAMSQGGSPGMSQMQQSWGTPSPQPMQGGFYVQPQQQSLMVQQQQQYPAQPPQPVQQQYFDPAQAAARYAHQQQNQHRQR